MWWCIRYNTSFLGGCGGRLSLRTTWIAYKFEASLHSTETPCVNTTTLKFYFSPTFLTSQSIYYHVIRRHLAE